MNSTLDQYGSCDFTSADVEGMFWIISLWTTACHFWYFEALTKLECRTWSQFTHLSLITAQDSTIKANGLCSLMPFRYGTSLMFWDCLTSTTPLLVWFVSRSHNHKNLVYVQFKSVSELKVSKRLAQPKINVCWMSLSLHAKRIGLWLEKIKHTAWGSLGTRKDMFKNSLGASHLIRMMEAYHLTWMTSNADTWRLLRSKESSQEVLWGWPKPKLTWLYHLYHWRVLIETATCSITESLACSSNHFAVTLTGTWSTWRWVKQQMNDEVHDDKSIANTPCQIIHHFHTLKTCWQHNVHFICSASAARSSWRSSKPACGIAQAHTETTYLLWVSWISSPGFGPLCFQNGPQKMKVDFRALIWCCPWFESAFLKHLEANFLFNCVHPVLDPTLMWKNCWGVSIRPLSHCDHSGKQTESDESEGRPGSHNNWKWRPMTWNTDYTKTIGSEYVANISPADYLTSWHQNSWIRDCVLVGMDALVLMYMGMLIQNGFPKRTYWWDDQAAFRSEIQAETDEASSDANLEDLRMGVKKLWAWNPDSICCFLNIFLNQM